MTKPALIRLASATIMLVGLSLIAWGSWGYLQQYTATHTPQPIKLEQVVTTSTDTPSETPPSDSCKEQAVAPSDPHVLKMPSIGVDSCIQKVSTDQNGDIAAPSNVHLAGWYVKSVTPGEKGISLIDGHVSGRYSEAIFKRLKDLSPGTQVSVQRGDGQVVYFEVVDVTSYPAEKVMDALFNPLEGVDSQLTLITCGGKFDRQSQTYADRVVVRAKLIS